MLLLEPWDLLPLLQHGLHTNICVTQLPFLKNIILSWDCQPIYTTRWHIMWPLSASLLKQKAEPLSYTIHWFFFFYVFYLIKKKNLCVCVCVPWQGVHPSSPAGRLCPVGITCHGAESLIDASCFSGGNYSVQMSRPNLWLCNVGTWARGRGDAATPVSRCEGGVITAAEVRVYLG